MKTNVLLLCFSLLYPIPLFSNETAELLESQCGPLWADQNRAALGKIKSAVSATTLTLSEAEQAVEALQKLTECQLIPGSHFTELKNGLSISLARQLEDHLADDDAAGPGVVLALQLFEQNVSQRKAFGHSAPALASVSLRKVLKGACLSAPSRSLASVEELGKEPSLALVEAMSAMERVATKEATKSEDQKQLLFLSPDLDWSALALQETLPGTVANQIAVRAIDYFHTVANDLSYLSDPKAQVGLAAYLGKPRKSLLPSFSRSLSKATDEERNRWREFSIVLSTGLKAMENGGGSKQDLMSFGSATLLGAMREYESVLLGRESRLIAAVTLDWVEKTDQVFADTLSRAPASEWKEAYRASLVGWAKSLDSANKEPPASDRVRFFNRSLAPQLAQCLFLSELYPEEDWREVCSKWRCVTLENKGCASESIAQAMQSRYVEHGELCSANPRKTLTRQILDRLPRFNR